MCNNDLTIYSREARTLPKTKEQLKGTGNQGRKILISLFQPYAQYGYIYAVMQNHADSRTLKQIHQGMVQIDQREGVSLGVQNGQVNPCRSLV